MASNEWDDAYSKIFKKGVKVFIALTSKENIVGTVIGFDRKYFRVIVKNDGHTVVIPLKRIVMVKILDEEGNTDESNANTSADKT